jgi:hypothetical protein
MSQPDNTPQLLEDILAFALIVKAQNHIAARQFLGYLTRYVPIDPSPSNALNYQRQVVRKACKLAGPSAQQWVEALY